MQDEFSLFAAWVSLQCATRRHPRLPGVKVKADINTLYQISRWLVVLAMNGNSSVSAHGVVMRCKINQHRILPSRKAAVISKHA
jgi:hypothetical protein